MFTDVLVLGSGIAGQAAALRAAQQGARVLVATKAAALESNSLYAQAGIAAALGDDDSIAQHVADTLGAGDGLCDEGVVLAAVAEGPDAVAWLERSGVRFDRDEADGPLSLGREGGHTARRVARARGDATGSVIQEALGARIADADRIRVVPDAFAVDVVTVNGRCVGAAILWNGDLRLVWASSVVVATGGAARLFRESTNPKVTTGDGIAMAYRAGAEVRDMEFMQFHPTVLYVPGASRALISEAARGEGAVITDTAGRRFLFDVDPRGELAPRDVVSRGIVAHLLEHGGSYVLLDLTSIDRARLESRLPGVVATGRRVGIDVTRQPLPVRPAAHYTIGGIVADADGRTCVPGLFAAGEVAATGLHGANRLASNSLLEGAVFGRRAGLAAASESAARGRPVPYDVDERGPATVASSVDVQDVLRTLKSLVWREAGVQRSGAGLACARRELAGWVPLILERALGGPRGLEAQNLCILAELLLEAAELRCETRGVHWRSDHPTRRDDAFLGHFVQRLGHPTRFVTRAGSPS